MIGEEEARLAAAMLSVFLRDHPDFDLRVIDMGDGTCSYRVVRKDEPCGAG